MDLGSDSTQTGLSVLSVPYPTLILPLDPYKTIPTPMLYLDMKYLVSVSSGSSTQRVVFADHGVRCLARGRVSLRNSSFGDAQCLIFRRDRSVLYTHRAVAPGLRSGGRLVVAADRDRSHSSTNEYWEHQSSSSRGAQQTREHATIRQTSHAFRVSQQAAPQLWQHFQHAT